MYINLFHFFKIPERETCFKWPERETCFKWPKFSSAALLAIIFREPQEQSSAIFRTASASYTFIRHQHHGK
jgi:hypothetical protein